MTNRFFSLLLMGMFLMCPKYVLAQITAPTELHLQFVQVKTVPLLTEPQTSTGTLVYREPDYLCWQYLTPQVVKWEMRGDKSNMKGSVKGMIKLIMESVQGKNLQTNANFSVVQENNRYTLTPKRGDLQRLFSQIVIVYHPGTGIAQMVELTECDNSRTVLTFTPMQE